MRFCCVSIFCLHFEGFSVFFWVFGGFSGFSAVFLGFRRFFSAGLGFSWFWGYVVSGVFVVLVVFGVFDVSGV